MVHSSAMYTCTCYHCHKYAIIIFVPFTHFEMKNNNNWGFFASKNNSSGTLWNIIGTSLIRRKGGSCLYYGHRKVLLLQKLATKTLIKNRWASHNVHNFFLHRFWEKLWTIDLPQKMLWMLSDRALPTGEWSNKRGLDLVENQTQLRVCGNTH